jgi:hypothetical protein
MKIGCHIYRIISRLDRHERYSDTKDSINRRGITVIGIHCRIAPSFATRHELANHHSYLGFQAGILNFVVEFIQVGHFLNGPKVQFGVLF